MSTPKSLQLPSGVRQRTIETSRGKFAAVEALPVTGVRERQPALLVPGYTGSKEDFLLILQALAAAGRQVIAIDMRGQHETPGGDDAAAYQLNALAADVATIADWLTSGRSDPAGAASDGANTGGAAPDGPPPRGIHLLGHSLGGLVAREVLLAQAARISSLTLMSSGPGALTGPRAAVLSELLAELDGTGPAGLRVEIERIWKTRMEPEAMAGGVPAGIIDFLRTRLLRSSPTGLRAMGETLLSCPDRTAALARLGGVPLMVVYGENDDAWEPAAQEDMAAQLGAQRVCIPAAAHSPAVEAPETTASTLTGFWNTVECHQSRTTRTP
ncbi:MAG TPA: alpha/beta hydrolase [Streptosporangiaceae bacterium]